MTCEAGPGGGAQAVLPATPLPLGAGELARERLAAEVRGTLGGGLIIAVFTFLVSSRLCDVSVCF